MTAADLGRLLAELGERATPGEWRAVPKTNNGYELRAPAPALQWSGAAEVYGGEKNEIPVAIETWSRFTPPGYDEMVTANFELIAALHNNLPLILDALAQMAPAREDCVRVPREPSEAMIDAGANTRLVSGCYDAVVRGEIATIYRAMLAAAEGSAND